MLYLPLNVYKGIIARVGSPLIHGGVPSHVSRHLCAQIPSFNLSMVDAGNAPLVGLSPNGNNIDRLIRASIV